MCSSSLHGAVVVGWEGELETFFHDVSGTVTVLNSSTLQFENFNYDGGGPAVYFYLTNDIDDVESGFIVGPLLTGTVYSDNDFTVDLGGRSLDDFNAISVWCADFDIDFGSGEFVEPSVIPEPSSGVLLISAGVCSLLRRRR